ncbi:hypothetical protein SAMN06265365_11089 [Tistlia consotensis]|uniref:Uncharacterized protein n=1 Tax=Tistlia consotensis USBA 355 TaxID=560819 RepID=A0A1Y6BT56_9PROT|nr:hypothetical protein [Tistlia consotensis]SMF27227.1 hypothetical protein SAMN05428998_10967 [Tistlia consotensis USBA 355]SNR66354.1 hypothetical protein SAMN06265365_11089 [Tistlia consotensis]
MSIYRRLIEPHAAGFDPRHIEAYMRVGHATLDGLSPQAFLGEVVLARLCVEQAGAEQAERVARSFGL